MVFELNNCLGKDFPYFEEVVSYFPMCRIYGTRKDVLRLEKLPNGLQIEKLSDRCFNSFNKVYKNKTKALALAIILVLL